MTEQEWNAAVQPDDLLRCLLAGRDPSVRKLRLFGCACVRRVWPLLDHERCRQAVELAERYADGLASHGELRAARAATRAAVRQCYARVVIGVGSDFGREVRRSARSAARDVTQDRAEVAAREAGRNAANAAAQAARLTCGNVPMDNRIYEVGCAAARSMQKVQCHVLRDLFGCLRFRPLVIPPAWLAWNAGTIPALARAAYDHRDLPAGTLDPARLAVLADALEEAGCDNTDLLGHLRGRGPHFRGCFAIDRILQLG